jgi:hypothetical protein
MQQVVGGTRISEKRFESYLETKIKQQQNTKKKKKWYLRNCLAKLERLVAYYQLVEAKYMQWENDKRERERKNEEVFTKLI